LALDDRILLAVGRMSPIKGFDVLLEALARLADPQATMLFVGGSLGSTGHRAMETRARRLQIEHRVRFVGSVDHDLLPTYYAACDVCVIPSLYESFGLVALESIGCGRPVVASRVGGLQSLVVDEVSGVLVTPGSVSELAAALAHVLRAAGTVGSAMPTVPTLPSWSTTAGAISAALMAVA
jgi:glycosyltransferase involved in cell wall biosynthesis